MIGNRSANRGSCAGPCRKKYSLYTTSGKLIEKNKYLLSKKDIFGLDKLQQLIDAGVYSLKIEGRNKTPEYVAGVVKNYRQALDIGYSDAQEKEVLQLFNRSGKSAGYLQGIRYRQSISEFSPKNTGLLLGKVIEVKKQYVKVNLKEDIDLHDGIETIGNLAFSDCSNLLSISIPSSLINIGYMSFDGCSNLSSIIIPNSVKSIGYSAFANCSSLSSITIPDSITNIEYNTFFGCSSLNSIIISNSVISIEDDAFLNCDNVIIYTPKGSYAEAYAIENNIPYQNE